MFYKAASTALQGQKWAFTQHTFIHPCRFSIAKKGASLVVLTFLALNSLTPRPPSFVIIGTVIMKRLCVGKILAEWVVFHSLSQSHQQRKSGSWNKYSRPADSSNSRP